MEKLDCPFCHYKKVFRTKNVFFEEEGIDYWTCPRCGEENIFGLGGLEKNFEVFKTFTEKSNWKGLLDYCQKNQFDELDLHFLARDYLGKKDYSKAEKILRVLLRLNPKDKPAKELLGKIKTKDKKKKIGLSLARLIKISDSDQQYFYDCKRNKLVKEKTAGKNLIKIPQLEIKEKENLKKSFIHELREHFGRMKIAEELVGADNFELVLRKYPKIKEHWEELKNNLIKEKIAQWLAKNNFICRTR